MTVFDMGAKAIFADLSLAAEAIHRVGGTGVGTPIRAIRRAPDRYAAFNEGRFVSDTILLHVRTEAIPLLAAGDTIQIGAEVYEVRGDPVRDADRLIWTAEARAL